MGHTVGSHQLNQEKLFAGRQGESTVLTSEEESVSVNTPGGQEAEDIIRDVLVLSDRLIHLVLQGRSYGWRD